MEFYKKLAAICCLLAVLVVYGTDAAIGTPGCIADSTVCIAGNNEVCDTGVADACECDAANGYLSTDGTTCVLADCGVTSDPADGTVALDSVGVTTYLATATVTCSVGYSTGGGTAITCGATGSWTALTCTIRDCGVTSDPADGTVALDSVGVTTYLATATVTCSVGYSTGGGTAITCGATGSWTALTCTIRDCGVTRDPADGTVALDSVGVTTYLATATVTCSVGYSTGGGTAITCGATGSWTALTCTIRDCGVTSDPADGTVALDSVGVTTYLATATVTCSVGYSTGGGTAITCGATGSWTALTCTIRDCGATSDPADGTVALDSVGVTTYLATATVTCSVGYSTGGGTAITCGATGSWTALTCTLDDCGTPTNPTDGSISLVGGTATGNTATVTCNSGYTLSTDTTSETITCQADGSWTTIPTCAAGCAAITGSVLLVLLFGMLSRLTVG